MSQLFVGPVVALLAGVAMFGQTATGRPSLVNVTPRASAEVVAPEERFQLLLDLVPAAGMHVYAPEVRNYRPIAVRVDAQPGLSVVGAPRYPVAESYYYAPLKETVPVYQKPFRVVQVVSVDRSFAAGSTVTIAGALTYQACDDRLCYPPRTIPLAWKVRVKETP